MSRDTLPDIKDIVEGSSSTSTISEEISDGYTQNDIESLLKQDADSESLTNDCMTRLQAASFSTVLQESLDTIKILGLMGGLPSVNITLDYQSLVEKYEKEDTQSFIFDPETLEPYEGSLKKKMLLKFQKDRSYIEQVLEEANEELIRHFRIETFMKRLREFKLSQEERNCLMKENFENLSTINRLSTQLEKDKIDLSADLQTKSETLGKLKDEYEDLIYENDIKFRYIDRWESARCAQNKVEMERVENYHSNTIREYYNNYERENRINIEIEAYLTETEDAHLGDIEMWSEKFDKDLETKDMDIQVMREKRDEQTSRLEALIKLYAEHEKEIQDYLIQKEERLKEEEILAQRNRAATKIQAWWRGTMYRKGLGPYKKKKGKKGKGGSGKGKKKS